MQAIVVEQIGAFVLRDVPRPRPAADELLLKVLVTGLCRTDLKLIRQGHRDLLLPRIPGEEVVGEVVGPVDAPDKVYLLWAASETPAGVPPFAEAKSKVAQAYQNEKSRIWEQEIRKEYLDKAGYKFLLPLDAPKAPHM